MTIKNKLAAGAGTLLVSDEFERRAARLHEPHIQPLTALVEVIHARSGEEVPWFDPRSAGVNAEVLVLLRDPSKVARFISIDNNDRTAQNTTAAYQGSDLEYSRAVHWNVVPWQIGNRNEKREAQRARPYLLELIELLPRLRVVLVLGNLASSAWQAASPETSARIIYAPHPGPRSWNNVDRSTELKRSVLTTRAFQRAAAL